MRPLSVFILLAAVLAGSVPVCADTPPRWATGTFSGRHSRLDARIWLSIRPDGYARREVTDWRGSRQTAEGRFEDGELRLGGRSYYVDRTAEGLRVTNTRDSQDWALLRRESGGDWGHVGGRVPVWAVGVFSGRHDSLDVRMELDIRPSGRVRREVTDRRGTRRVDEGMLDDGELRIGGEAYLVDRAPGGIRVANIRRPADFAVLRRRDGGWAGAPGRGEAPWWMVGTFRGRHRGNGMDVEVTIWRDGRVRRVVTDGRGSEEVRDGEVRDGQIRVDGRAYYVSRVRGGIRVTGAGDSDDTVVLMMR